MHPADPLAFQVSSKQWPELVTLVPHRLVANIDTPLGR
jgi:hypothetical protein